MITYEATKRGLVAPDYDIRQGDKEVGSLRQSVLGDNSQAMLHGVAVELTRLSSLWEGYDIRLGENDVVASYALEPFQGSLAARAKQLMGGRAGLATLGERTYRFAKKGGALVWTPQDSPEDVLVEYRLAVTPLRSGKWTITVLGDLPAEDATILVLLGLHVSIRRYNDDSAAGSAAIVG